MFRIVLTCAMLTAGFGLAVEPSKAEVKKLATALGEAMIAGDVTAIIDATYPSAVELLGGKKKAVEQIGESLKKMKVDGFEFKKFEVGEPGDFQTEGANTFAVVPSALDMGTPDGRTLRSRGYLLGISPDGGKTWKFVDGAGMATQAARDKVLPKLPAKLVLPPKSLPELLKK